MDLTAFADEVGSEGPVTVSGLGTRGGAVPHVRRVVAPSGIEWVQADEMTVACGAGTTVAELSAALAEVGQRTVLPDGGTVGGALARGHSGIRRLGDGPLRDVLLQTRYVGADGALVKAGGPTVKNVSGFDVCRLLVGSMGTLGFLGEVILRTRPTAPHAQWFVRETDDPMAVFATVHRPIAVLWDGTWVHALLEGQRLDVEETARLARLSESAGPPRLPEGRHTLRPADVLGATARLAPGSFVAELGLGVVHAAPGSVAPPIVDTGVAAIARRVKQQFDPLGRLNPGREV